jgi:YD repeat-containing protein
VRVGDRRRKVAPGRPNADPRRDQLDGHRHHPDRHALRRRQGTRVGLARARHGLDCRVHRRHRQRVRRRLHRVHRRRVAVHHRAVVDRRHCAQRRAAQPGAGPGARRQPRAADLPGHPDAQRPDDHGHRPLDPRNNKPTDERDARSSSPSDPTYDTVISYTAAAEMASKTSPPTAACPSGCKTTYTYTTGSESATGGGTEPAGLLASTTSPDGGMTAYAYDSAGDVAKVTNPVGLVTTTPTTTWAASLRRHRSPTPTLRA